MSFENPYTLYILYITSAFVGVFAVSFCVFVGIHLYRQCIKKVNIPEQKGDGDVSNTRIGYSSLFTDSHQHTRDPTYLEPVFSLRRHSVESMNHLVNELSLENMSAIRENTNVKISYAPCILPHSKSAILPSKLRDGTIGYSKKKVLCTSSL